ncbi:hypothetical protein ACLOJK_016850 [Asimina triloba]
MKRRQLKAKKRPAQEIENLGPSSSSLGMDSEDYVLSSEGHDSWEVDSDDVGDGSAVQARQKKRNRKRQQKKRKGTKSDPFNGSDGEEEAPPEIIDLDEPIPVRRRRWRKDSGRRERKRRERGEPPLIWEVLEEDNEKWIDEHENDLVDLDGGECAVETGEPPPDLIMPLLRFQKEWLAWALKQEESPIKGGILADEMGMGKTIQAISLILAARACGPTYLDPSPSSITHPAGCPAYHEFLSPSSMTSALPKMKGTLVICPVVAVVQWMNEIMRFTAKGSVSILVYHGAKREKAIQQLSTYDFVLTTYSIVEAEYRKNNMPPKERCQWCGKLFYPRKMATHLKYFCGPNAVKTEKQSKQVKKKQQDTGSRKKFKAVQEEEKEDEVAVEYLKPVNRKGSVKAKKRGESSKKDKVGSCNNEPGGEGSLLGKSILHSVKWERIILDEFTPPVMTHAWGMIFEERGAGAGMHVITRGRSRPVPICFQFWPPSNTTKLAILIQAHYIKDRRCNTARAVLSLHSVYKWALSGTPLQNRVGELYSLYIAKPIQKCGYVNDGRRAMILLKNKLLKSVVLRRTKKGRAADLALPPRFVSLRRDTLDKTEEDFYEALYTQSQAQFNTYVEAGTLMNNYAHIFDLLTRLRQAVDHPYLVIYSQSALPSGSKIDNADQQECGICHDPAEDPVVTSCKHVFCKACLLDYSTALGQREEIRRMVECDGSAKAIVFSQFTSYLDLINYSLQKSGINCVQLVGSMSMAARDDAIKKFSGDPKCRIFLMSLKAGGVALNLTVASYVRNLAPYV